MGAELIIIPTANLTCEPMEMFEWEVRVQAMQECIAVGLVLCPFSPCVYAKIGIESRGSVCSCGFFDTERGMILCL